MGHVLQCLIEITENLCGGNVFPKNVARQRATRYEDKRTLLGQHGDTSGFTDVHETRAQITQRASGPRRKRGLGRSSRWVGSFS